MPISHPAQLNEIVTMIMMTRPAAMHDVGVGFLAREYLDLWGRSYDLRLAQMLQQ